MRNLLVAGIGAAIASTAFSSVAAAADAPGDVINGIDLTLGVHASYDDNLYRLPDSIDPATLAGPGATRTDYVQRGTVGLDGHWQWSRQKLLLDLDANANRYEHNDQLDNTAGRGSLEWDWHASSLFSGKLGGDYSRSLANFANTRFLGKDLLETTGEFASFGFRLGPSWHLKAGGRHAETEHSAAERAFDNSRTDTVTAGLEYETSSDNTIGLQARRTEATFDNGLTLNGFLFNRDYEDEALTLEVERVFSPRTQLTLSAGYLQREYRDPTLAALGKGSFDGGVGEFTLDWQATNKITLGFSGWRKLRAYLDAESDYFIALGGSIAATWTPTGKIVIGLEGGYEKQEYLGTSFNLETAAREDRVRSASASIKYTPRRRLTFELMGRKESRGSDRDLLAYDSQVASVGIRWTY
jgi:exopolysaccharide biosynthesis operon protein EpsL